MKKIYDLFCLIKGVVWRFFYLFFFELTGTLNILPLFSYSLTCKKKIAFQSYTPHLAQFFSPIINELKKEEDIELFFLINFHPYYGTKGMKELKEYLMNVMSFEEHQIKFSHQTLWVKYDALICNDVYAYFPILKSLRILLTHGPGISRRDITKSFLRKSIYDFDHYFLPGNFDYNRIKKVTAKKPQIYNAGLPFVDPLASSYDRKMLKQSLSFETNKKIVIFAPSWGPAYLKEDIVSSYFHKVVDSLVMKDILILIKLHAVSLNKYQSKGISWSTVLDRYKTCANIKVITDIYDIPYFQVSDLLITDISSRSFNFMITGRPVIVTGVPESYIHDPVDGIRMKKIMEGSYFLKDFTNLPELVDRLLNKGDEMYEHRKKVADEVFSFQGVAGKENARLIKKLVSSQ